MSLDDVRTIDEVCDDYVTEHLGRLCVDDRTRSCVIRSELPVDYDDDDIMTRVVNDDVVKYPGKNAMLVVINVFRRKKEKSVD